MSQLGQKRKRRPLGLMSALTQQADIFRRLLHVGFGPEPDVTRLVSRFGLLLAPDQSPTQTLQFLHVAVQAKQTSKRHDVPEGRNMEAGLLPDKQKPEKGCSEHEAGRF